MPRRRRHWRTAQAPRWLHWNELPPESVRREIRALRIRLKGDARLLEFPTSVSQMTALEYLSIPLALASKIRPGSLPASLRVLHFDESVGGAASIRPDVVLPSVVAVSAVNGGLRFARETFPNLEHASLRLGPRSKMAEVLISYGKLRSLHLGSVNSFDGLGGLSTLGLETLGFVGGRLESLSGIAAAHSLRNLWLNSLSHLSDISAIRSLPNLESIDILYCNALEDLAPILDAPQLQSVAIVSCKAIRLREVADALMARPWKKLAITGNKHLYRRGDGWVLKA